MTERNLSSRLELEPFTRAQRLAICRAERRDQRLARVHRSFRRAVAVMVAVFTGFVGLTGASAYFSAHGTGTGTARTAALQSLSLTTSANITVSSDFAADGNNRTINIPVHNPNPTQVTVISIVAGAVTVDSGHVASGCSSGSVTFTNQNALNATLNPVAVIPPGGDLSLHALATMGTNANNACQGALITIPVTISVHQP